MLPETKPDYDCLRQVLENIAWHPDPFLSEAVWVIYQDGPLALKL